MKALRKDSSVLVLAILALGCTDRPGVRAEGAGAQRPDVVEERVDTAKEGIVLVKGPCGSKPCCKPVELMLPKQLPKGFSPRIGIKIVTAPDGSVRKVDVIKSSGIGQMDRRLQEGAKKWCMEKSSEGREVQLMITVDVR